MQNCPLGYDPNGSVLFLYPERRRDRPQDRLSVFALKTVINCFLNERHHPHQKNDKFRQKFVVFQLYSPCGELYAQTRDICFTSDMRFALLRLQGEYNITVSIIREANWRTISLRAQRVISRRAKRGISPKSMGSNPYRKTKNIFFIFPLHTRSTSEHEVLFVWIMTGQFSGKPSNFALKTVINCFLNERHHPHQKISDVSNAILIATETACFKVILYFLSFIV